MFYQKVGVASLLLILIGCNSKKSFDNSIEDFNASYMGNVMIEMRQSGQDIIVNTNKLIYHEEYTDKKEFI